MTIQEAVAEIIRLREKGNFKEKDIFRDLKKFLAFLDDLAPEYQKERKIIKNNFDDNILGLFVDETKRPNQRLRWVQIKLDDVGLAKDWADFIIESFGLAFGWEDEVRDLKVNVPILNNAPKTQPQKQPVNTNVQDITLNEDLLKQWGFMDKKAIPDVLNIPSTYKTFSGTIYRITKIGNEVFKDCDQLQTVTIPDTVTEIGESAFENCRALEKINIPDSVTKIANRAFENCNSLVNITLPDSVVEIGNSAFGGCSSLIGLFIPNKIAKIPEGLFAKCKSLVNVTIPNGVTEIGDFAFAGCESLPNVIIPKTVTKIGNKTFVNCKSLESIIIPKSVTNIGTEVFTGCSKLEQFTLPTRYTIFKDDVNKEVDLSLNFFWFKTEYQEGISLEEYLKKTPQLSESDTLEFLNKLLPIIRYLHTQEPPIIYRDLQPKNIYINVNGVYLAKYEAARTYKADKIKDTVIVSTRGYTSPEQALGKGQSDPRSDIFSIGMIIFQMLTGKDPTASLILPKVSDIRKDISPIWTQLVAKATNIKRDKRYNSIDELMIDLNKIGYNAKKNVPHY